MRITTIALLLAGLGASVAHADALGGCPEGQTFHANPTQPGAMHHAGGECVPDGGSSHCAAMPGHSSASGTLAFAMLGLGAAVIARRGKVRAR